MAELFKWEPSGTKALGLKEVVAPLADFHEGHFVCSVSDHYYDKANNRRDHPRELVEARCRLIAAAPCLLAALKRLRAERAIPGTETLAVVDAAIAKAEATGDTRRVTE